MDILEATRSYESWLGGLTELYPPDLDYKHKQMGKSTGLFPFFRGTYYRWVQRWAEAAGDLAGAPVVLAVGDLHVENFGTWRDLDGRLCWGVNDFDEADRLPYTHDLVRLAVSVRFARGTATLDVKFLEACKLILTGYVDALKARGMPFVLEENHLELRALAMSKDRSPQKFWKQFPDRLIESGGKLLEQARTALLDSMPPDATELTYYRRIKTGMGSLGKPRYVALAKWVSGLVAREVKAITPPATAWAAGRSESPSFLSDAIRQAIRCPDPFYKAVPGWVLRRLGPRCNRLELPHLKQADDLDHVLRGMGAETANVHLGTPNMAEKILADLAHRPKDWLPEGARSLSKLLEEDWTAWRNGR